MEEKDEKPKGAYAGKFDMNTVNIVPIEVKYPLKKLKFTLNKFKKIIIALEIHFYDTDIRY